MKKEFYICDICEKKIDGTHFERSWRIFSPDYFNDSEYEDIDHICGDCERKMNAVMWRKYLQIKKETKKDAHVQNTGTRKKLR